MKRFLLILIAGLFMSCSFSAPENVNMAVITWNISDTNGDGIKNELHFEAVIENTGGQRAIDVKTKVFAVYPNSREEIDSYFGNLYGGDKIILEGYHEIGAKDLRDVVIEKY